MKKLDKSIRKVILTQVKVIDSYVELGRAVSVSESEPEKSKFLRFYESKFLSEYLKETERFYSLESAVFLELSRNRKSGDADSFSSRACNITEYLRKAETRLDEENLRCEKYLHESSNSKIKDGFIFLSESCYQIYKSQTPKTVFCQQKIIKIIKNYDCLFFFQDERIIKSSY